MQDIMLKIRRLLNQELFENKIISFDTYYKIENKLVDSLK